MRETKVMIRLSDAEKELLDQAAQTSGLMTASWARMMLLRLARQPTKGEEAELADEQRQMGLLSLFCGAGGLDEGFRQAMAALDRLVEMTRGGVEELKRSVTASGIRQPSGKF